MTHKWKASTLGHGETQCEYCKANNREITVIGDMNFCPDAPVTANDDKVPVKMKAPWVPSYVWLDIPHSEAAKIPVCDLTVAQADWMAAEYRKGLDVIANEQRGNAK